MKGKLMLSATVFAVIAITYVKYATAQKTTSSTKEKTVSSPIDETKGWSEASKMAAITMKKQYGEPDAKTADMMMWKNTGQWTKTVVYGKESKHDFPMPHTDEMQQWIEFKVPAEKFNKIAMFDGSIVCNRTNGDISARCDKEGANVLAINLANDVVIGNKDYKTARDFYATTVKKFVKGGTLEYMQKLQFDVSNANTADADSPSTIITDGDMVKEKKWEKWYKRR